MSARSRTNPDSVMDPLPDEAKIHDKAKDTAKADKKEAPKGDKEKTVEQAALASAIESLKEQHDKAKATIDELTRLEKGEVGGEKDVKVKPEEKKAAEKIIEEAEEKVDASHVLKLAGTLEDQMDALEEFSDKLFQQHKEEKMSAKDAELYQKLYKVGSTQDSKTGKYSKISDIENARLRKIEGPLITREVIAKMAAGEISWSTNGAYAAMNLLRAGRLPATGKRPGAGAAGTAEAAAKTEAGAGGDIIDMKTGKKMTGVEIAAAAALAGGVLIEALSGDGSPDAAPAPADAEKSKADYDVALEEMETLLAEIEALDDDNAIFHELANLPPGADRAAALEADSPIIAKYLRLSDASASIEEIKAIFPGIKDSEAESFKKLAAKIDYEYYRKHVVEPMFALTGGDRILAFETALNRAQKQAKAMRLQAGERVAAVKAKIIEQEKNLVDAGHVAPDYFLNRDITASEARLAAIKAQLSELNVAADKNRLIARTEDDEMELDEQLGDILYEVEELSEAANKEAETLENLVARREKARAKAKPADDDRSYADYAGGSNPDHDREEAEAAELEKEFAPGDIVKVERGDKIVEDGWQIAEVKDGDALVIKHDEAYEKKYPGKSKVWSKRVRLSELKGWQTAKTEAAAKTEVKGEADELMDQAKALLDKDGEISHHSIQVTLKVGYNRADAILARMEKDGLIDPKVGTEPQKKASPKTSAPATASAPAAAGKYEPAKRVKPNDRIAADIGEARNAPKTGAEIYRTTKADDKTRPPNPDSEIITKETYKHAREIIKARKDTYRDDIASGALDAAELTAIKERLLSAESHEEAVKKILSAGEKEKLVIIAPFVEDMYRQIMADTDELIALAEKAPVPAAAAAKGDTDKEKREAAAKIMAEARATIADRTKDLDSRELDDLEETRENITDLEAKDLKDQLIEKKYLRAEAAEKLSPDNIFTLRFELAAAYKKAIDRKKKTVSAPAAAKSVEPKPDAGKDLKAETAKIMSEARATLAEKTKDLGSRDLDDLEETEEDIKSVDAEDVKAKLIEKGYLGAEAAEKLSNDDAFMLRYELVAAYRKAIDRKNKVAPQPAAAKSGDRKPNAGKIDREPITSGVEQAEQFLQTRGEGLLANAGSNDVETLNATRNAVETADTATLKAYLIDSGIPQAQVDVLNDQNLEILRGIETTNLLQAFDRAKKLRKKELTEINRVMGQKKLVKGFSQISDPLKLDPESLRELSSLVEQATPGDKTATELIKALLEKAKAK